MCVRMAKKRKEQLRAREEYVVFHTEIESKLKEILYLPIEYESDVPEEDDD